MRKLKLTPPLFSILVMLLLFSSLTSTVYAEINIVENGGFEYEFNGWTGDGTQEISTTRRTGTYSAMDSNGDAILGNTIFQQYFGVDTDDLTYFGFWYRSDGTNNLLIEIDYEYNLSENIDYSGGSALADTSGAWAWINITAVVDFDANDYLSRIYFTPNCGGGSDILYIDDVTIYSGSTSGGTPSAGFDSTMEALMSFIIPLMVILIPAFLLFIIGGPNLWMVLLGTTIGAGLGYYFGLVPAWVIFLMIIVDVGMAFRTMKGD